MGLYCDKLFPWVLDNTEPIEMSKQRTLTLQKVSGKIVEIGLGTGGNLPYYPKHIQNLTAVEPSEGMHMRAKKRAIKTKRTVEWYQAKGEQLPFDNCQFDTVVTTQLLCTIEDIQSVLSEAFRILKPGGLYYFLEHVISKEPAIYKWQNRLNSVHKRVACGCELTRDIEKCIRESEFEIKEFHEIPLFAGLDQKIYPFIRGVAIKPVL